MASVATPTAKGQNTIPAEVRRALSLGPGDKVVGEVSEGRCIILPVGRSLPAFLAGLGKEVWVAEGGSAAYLERERDARDEP